MIPWRPSYHTRIAQAGDFLTAEASFIAAYYLADFLHRQFPYFFPRTAPLQTSQLLVVLVIGFCYVVLFSYQNAYSYQRFTSLFREYIIVFKVTSLGILIDIALLFLVRFGDLSRTIVIAMFLVSVLFFLAEKTLMFEVAAFIRGKGKNRRRVLLVGTGRRARQFIEAVDCNFKWGLDIVGVLAENQERVGEEFCGKGIVDTLENIESALKNTNPQEVIITISTKRFDLIRSLLEVCEQQGVVARLNSNFFGRITKDVTVDKIYGLDIITFSMVHQSEAQLILKRLIDIVVSFIALVMLSPLVLLVALGILITDGRPVLYQWNVVGLDRRAIKSWKFRTMVRNADRLKDSLAGKNEMSGPVFKIKDDPRILPFGRWLRKWSIDELPQLFSVLKGDLSLVGPRPAGPHELERYESWQRRKLCIKSGLTCLWQVNGRNKIDSFDEWVKLDLEYVDSWSIWLDLKILLKTIPAVLSGKGAS
jgi:exopolysaccharide biosynthesis polyprenyl glycosylphosphotransferase